MSSTSLSSYLPNDEDSFILQLPTSTSNFLLDDEDDDFRFLDDNSGFATPAVASTKREALTLQELTPKPAPLSPTRRNNSPFKQRTEQTPSLKAILTRRRERDTVEDVVMNSPARLDILKANFDEFIREEEMITEMNEIVDEPPSDYPILGTEESIQHVTETHLAEASSTQPPVQQDVIPDIDEDPSFLNSVAAKRLMEYGQQYLDPNPPSSSQVVNSTIREVPEVSEDQDAPQMEIERDDSPLTISQLSPSKTKDHLTTPKKHQSRASTPQDAKPAKKGSQNEVQVTAFSPMKPATKRAATPNREDMHTRKKLPKRANSMLKVATVPSSAPIPQGAADPVVDRHDQETSISTTPFHELAVENRKVVALPTKGQRTLASASKPQIFPPKTVAASFRKPISSVPSQPTPHVDGEQNRSDNVSIASTEQSPAEPPSLASSDAQGGQGEPLLLLASTLPPNTDLTNSGSPNGQASASVEPDPRPDLEQQFGQVHAKLVDLCEDHAKADNGNMIASTMTEPPFGSMDVDSDVGPRGSPVPVSTAAASFATKNVKVSNERSNKIANPTKKANTRSRTQLNAGSNTISTSRKASHKGIRERVLGLGVRKRPVAQSGAVTKTRQKNRQDSRRNSNSTYFPSCSATKTSRASTSNQQLGSSLREECKLNSSTPSIERNDSGELLIARETSTQLSRDLPVNSSLGSEDVDEGGQIQVDCEETRGVGKVMALNVEVGANPLVARNADIGNASTQQEETHLPTRNAEVASMSIRRGTTASRKLVSSTANSVASSSSTSGLSCSRVAHPPSEGTTRLQSTSQSSHHPPALTKPVEFNFASSKRLEERRALHASSSSLTASSSSSSSHIHPVPDFKSIHALNASLLASRREQFKPAPVVPVPFSSHLEERLKSRRAFDEQLRQRQEEAERDMIERKKEEEKRTEEETKEMRKQAVPKANPVPEWYKDAPKRQQS